MTPNYNSKGNICHKKQGESSYLGRFEEKLKVQEYENNNSYIMNDQDMYDEGIDCQKT